MRAVFLGSTEGTQLVSALIALSRAIAFTFALLGYGHSFAQTYPSKPVRLIVGFTPGGGVDINARLLAPKLAEFLGQPVIVENRPGAATNIANEHVAKAVPDGHTLLVTTAALAINMSLYKNLSFDALRDFAPISVFSESPNVLVVHAGVVAKSPRDLVALAQAKPGTMNYSSAGAGTTQHLSGELFKLRTKTQIVHVPYKGTAPSLTALVAGEVDMTFANIPAIIQHVKAGRLRPIASTGVKRSELMPDVPTLKEVGIDGVEVTVWYGVLAPVATPREIVSTLADSVVKAARSPDIRQRLLDQGAEPVGSTPDEFRKQLRDEVAKWAEVVAVSGARAE
jgi:tripartite-type tricarboxylate transporter receptor subunit TctC